MKTMTTIRTSSFNLFCCMLDYLNRKHVNKSIHRSDDIYMITLYDLDHEQTDALLSRMTAKLNLLPTTPATAA